MKEMKDWQYRSELREDLAGASSIADVDRNSQTWPKRRWTLFAIPLLLFATYAAYAPAAQFSFTYDDFAIIVHNPRVHSTRFMAQYFTEQVWGDNVNRAGNLYRPFFLTWLLANYQIFGLSPPGWHFTSILLHLFATWLVFLLARALLEEPNRVAALFAAAVFGLHPIHVEAVAWVSGVTESMSTCLFVGSFLCFLRCRTKHKFGIAASVLLFAGALCSKETAIVLPAVIVCYLLLFPDSGRGRWERASIRSMAATLAPYVLVVAIYVVVRSAVLHGIGHPVADIPVSSSALMLPWALYFYISQLLIPLGLGPFYDIDRSHPLSITGLILPLLVLAGFVLYLWWWTRKTRSNQPIFLTVWFVLTLAPAFGIFLLMSRFEGVHDRYLYLPSVAFAILAGYIWLRVRALIETPKSRTQQVVVALVLLTGMGLATRHQAEYWQNDLVLFTRACAVAPHNSLARLNLAAELMRRNRFKEALDEIRVATAEDPKSGIAYSLAGKAYYFLGRYSEAETSYLQALKFSPAEPEDLYYLAMSQIDMGKPIEGLEVLRRGLSLWSNLPQYHFAMGLALSKTGNWPGAQEEYHRELVLYPESQSARDGLKEASAHILGAARKSRNDDQ